MRGAKQRIEGQNGMTIENVASTLEERGIVWQGIGLAAIGVISAPLLWIYSDSNHWSIGIYRIATTQLSWMFVVALAVIIERIRQMFETKTEIRRRVNAKLDAEAEERGMKKGIEQNRRETEKRMRMAFKKRGMEVPPDFIEDVMNGKH